VPTLIGAEGVDGGPVPMALMAATVNVYVVPLTSPGIVWLWVGADTVTAAWAVTPTYGVITYPVSTEPPLSGFVHLTVAAPFPGAADTPPGAAGRTAGWHPTAPNNRTASPAATRGAQHLLRVRRSST
jgi:hypothetical protein